MLFPEFLLMHGPLFQRIAFAEDPLAATAGEGPAQIALGPDIRGN